MNGWFTPTKFPQLHRENHLNRSPPLSSSSSRSFFSRVFPLSPEEIPGFQPNQPTHQFPPDWGKVPPAPPFLAQKVTVLVRSDFCWIPSCWINWRKQDVSIWKNLCCLNSCISLYIRYTISWYFCGGIRGAIIIYYLWSCPEHCSNGFFGWKRIPFI